MIVARLCIALVGRLVHGLLYVARLSFARKIYERNERERAKPRTNIRLSLRLRDTRRSRLYVLFVRPFYTERFRTDILTSLSPLSLLSPPNIAPLSLRIIEMSLEIYSSLLSLLCSSLVPFARLSRRSFAKRSSVGR